MMGDQVDEQTSGIASLPAKDLDEIAQARYPQYSPEAVRLAREELSRRGLDWAKRAREEATGETEVEAARHPAGVWWKVWPTLCTLSGFVILIVIATVPALSQHKSVLYLGCLAFDLIALGFTNDFRLWRNRSARSHIRAVGMASIATLFTLWCLLCLLGIVNY
jgi:hypothetical protein